MLVAWLSFKISLMNVQEVLALIDELDAAGERMGNIDSNLDYSDINVSSSSEEEYFPDNLAASCKKVFTCLGTRSKTKAAVASTKQSRCNENAPISVAHATPHRMLDHKTVLPITVLLTFNSPFSALTF